MPQLGHHHVKQLHGLAPNNPILEIHRLSRDILAQAQTFSRPSIPIWQWYQSWTNLHIAHQTSKNIRASFYVGNFNIKHNEELQKENFSLLIILKYKVMAQKPKL